MNNIKSWVRTAFALNGLRKLKTKYQHIAESSVGITCIINLDISGNPF